jgi:predicted  nucleic acid-binding Zn-ribbon protein
MEKLDYLIKEKHDASSNSGSTNSHAPGLEQKIDSLSSQLKAMNDKIEKLESSISKHHDALEVGLGDVHDRISEAHDTIHETNDRTSHHLGKAFSELESIWSWVKYTTLIVGLLIVVYGLLAMVRKKEERKFI